MALSGHNPIVTRGRSVCVCHLNIYPMSNWLTFEALYLCLHSLKLSSTAEAMISPWIFFTSPPTKDL